MHLIKSITPSLGLGPEAESRKSHGGPGGSPRRLLMELCISIAFSRDSPQAAVGGEEQGDSR